MVRGAARLGALLTCATLLVGCSSAPPPSVPLGPTTADTRMAVQRLLDQRARAIRTDDRRLFLRGLDRSDAALVRREEQYFANLTALPLARFDYRVEGSWPLTLGVRRARLTPRVRLTMRLAAYDVRPVVRTTGYSFAWRDGRMVLVGDRTRTGRFFPGYDPQPWDLVPIRVRTGPDVLTVSDAGAAGSAPTVTDVVASAITQVGAAIPYTWNQHVVVYDFTSPRVLRSFRDVPGGNINHLGAMTFPVRVTPGRAATASMRFTVLPSSVRAGQPFLGRIVRHELTHVALGQRDDGVPTWLAEGLAEYVGARPVPEDQRRIASVAVSRARAPVGGMPASATFNDADQAWHYALSWMACDWIAHSQGEGRLWDLMTALHADGKGTSDADQDAVLLRVIGVDGHDLAQRAAARIQALYG